MAKVVGSISEQGWITDSGKMLDSLVSYYILTDNMQTLAFQGNLINLPVTYYKYINDPDGMAAEVKSDLDKLLSRYFISVDVETEAKPITGSKYGILLFVSVIDESNVKIDLSKVVQIDTGGLRKVINVSNYGDGLSLLRTLV